MIINVIVLSLKILLKSTAYQQIRGTHIILELLKIQRQELTCVIIFASDFMNMNWKLNYLSRAVQSPVSSKRNKKKSSLTKSYFCNNIKKNNYET